MYTLCSKIKIGEYTYNGINEVEITRSIDSLYATAKIKVPQTAVRIVDGKLFRTETRTDIVKEVNPGDEVYIQLGYNGIYYNEFKGYVKQIDYRTPLVIECEDEFYKCRSRYITIAGADTEKEPPKKDDNTSEPGEGTTEPGEKPSEPGDNSSEPGDKTSDADDKKPSEKDEKEKKNVNIPSIINITLRQLLEICGFKIGYAVPITITLNPVDTKSIAWLLDDIKKNYGLVIFFDTENKIYAGNIYQMLQLLKNKKDNKSVGATVKYRFRFNIIKDNDFKKKEQDEKVKFTGTIIGIDGQEITHTEGEGNEKNETKVTFYNIYSKEELKALVLEGYRRLKEGYTGKFETFLLPYVTPGMIAEISDPIYDVRNGEFIIKKVTTTFNSAGGRRTIEIGEKIWEL